MSVHPDACFPETADYNPINNELDKLLKTRRMKEIFVNEERREGWVGSSYITFSNKSNVIFHMADKEKHKEMKKIEKEKIL